MQITLSKFDFFLASLTCLMGFWVPRESVVSIDPLGKKSSSMVEFSNGSPVMFNQQKYSNTDQLVTERDWHRNNGIHKYLLVASTVQNN